MEKNEIIPFGYDDQLVRTVVIDGMPWFVAKDVCAALELTNPTEALKALDDDERGSLRISEGTSLKGGNPNMNIINESGLYTLIMRSNKPEAKRFRKWVTSEVLPSINRTGMYDRTGKLENLMERMEKVLIRIEKAQSTPSSYVCEQGREMVYEKMGPLGELFKQLNEQEDKRRQR